MINEGNLSMKKLILQTLNFALILVFVSCVSFENAHLVNLVTKESPSETDLILTASRPLQVKETKLENLPGLILSFPEDKVMSRELEVLEVNKGAVKRVKSEYFQSGGPDERQLNFMIVEFTRDLPYKIYKSGSSIIIRIEHSEPSPVGGQTLKTSANDNEVQPQIQKSPPLREGGYLVGPGDVLSIEVWRQPEVSRDVVVDDEGEIRLPPIKKILVMGMTVPQVEEKLTEALSKYLIDPAVFVTIKEFNSQRVVALGETKTGMYTLKRRTTLVEFLGQIGGPTGEADIFHIKLIKKDGQSFTYDLNELMKNPQKSEDVLVSGGDTLYVPPLEMNKVYVLGKVNSPKAIPIKGKLTLIDAITEAGGLSPGAAARSIIILRGEPGSSKGIRVNLNQILKNADTAQNIELVRGDIVYVPTSFIADVEKFMALLSPPLYWYVWLR